VTNARGIIALKVYGLLLGITALALGLAGVAKSHRHVGVITAGQYRSVRVGAVTRAGVLLYFGTPSRPGVNVALIDLAVATKARSACLVYGAQGHFALRYRLCFAAASDRMIIDVADVLAGSEHGGLLYHHRRERDDSTLDARSCLIATVSDGQLIEVWEHIYDVHAFDGFYG
jgi:hypothetical protein